MPIYENQTIYYMEKSIKIIQQQQQQESVNKGKSLTREASQETELLFSVGAFVASFLTLQRLKGNQTGRTYCHSSEPWGICHKIGT